MEFKEAKQVMRAALAGASDEKLCELQAAAEDDKMHWMGAYEYSDQPSCSDIPKCGCLAQRYFGKLTILQVNRQALSDAYYYFAPNDIERQALIVAMVKQEFEHRRMLAVKEPEPVLVNSGRAYQA